MPFCDLLDEIDADVGNLVGIDRDIVPRITRLTAQDKVYFVAADLDTNVSFGHFKRAREQDVPYGDPVWITEVRYARSLNMCWRRFVCCKELMHAFDSPEEQASSPERFRRLLTELELPPPNQSPMLHSENRTIWQAMAALAPARLIAKFNQPYALGTISNYDIAMELRIPEFYVPHIMHEAFPRVVQSLRNIR